jgi:hypothetical protein
VVVFGDLTDRGTAIQRRRDAEQAPVPIREHTQVIAVSTPDDRDRRPGPGRLCRDRLIKECVLQSGLGYINTLMIQDTLALPEWQGVLTDADQRGIAPIFHTNMTPYGEIKLDLKMRGWR